MALDIRQSLPFEAKLLIVPSCDDPFAVGLRYHLWQVAGRQQLTGVVILWYGKDFAQAVMEAKAHETNYLLVQDLEEGPLRRRAEGSEFSED